MFSFLYHYKDFYLTWLYRSSTSGYLIRSRTAYLSRLSAFNSVFVFLCGVRVARRFSFLCFPIICLYVPRSVLWWPLRIKTIIGSSFPRVVCRREHVLFTLFVFVWHSGVQPILCCVFALIFFFLWIVLFWLPLRYSRTFICPSGSH